MENGAVYDRLIAAPHANGLTQPHHQRLPRLINREECAVGDDQHYDDKRCDNPAE